MVGTGLGNTGLGSTALGGRAARRGGAVLAAVLAAAWVVAVPPTASAAVPGTFEVDGDLAAGAGTDWDGATGVTTTGDPAGPLGEVRARHELVRVKGVDHVVAELAFGAGAGGSWTVELAAAAGDAAPPAAGDLRLQLTQRADGPLLTGVQRWDGSPGAGRWTDVTRSGAQLRAASAVALGAADGLVEVAVDLTALGLVPDCGAPALTTARVADAAQAAVKVALTVPSTCGSLSLRASVDDGADDEWSTADDTIARVGGATFAISPNPLPRNHPASGLDPLLVVDDADEGTDAGPGEVDDVQSLPGRVSLPEVVAGSYMVWEVGGPTGMIPTEQRQQAVVREFLPRTLTFANDTATVDVAVAYEGGYDGPADSGAVLRMTRSDVPEGAEAPQVTVRDTGGDGAATFTGLGPGRWCLAQVGAPVGYRRDTATSCLTVGPVLVRFLPVVAWEDGVGSPRVTDARRPATARVWAAYDGAGTDGPRPELTLRRESDGLPGLTAGDAVAAAPRTTADDGSVEWRGLAWGPGVRYYAEPAAPPAGYGGLDALALDLSTFPPSGVLELGGTAGPRLPASVSLAVEGDGAGPLPGTAVALVRDDGDDVFDAASDTEVVAADGVADEDGRLSWAGLDWGAGQRLWAVPTDVPAGFVAGAPRRVDLTAYPPGGVLDLGVGVLDRSTVRVVVRPRDADGGAGLTGATVTLVAESDGADGPTPGDLPVPAPPADADGSVTWPGLAWGQGRLVHAVVTGVPAGFTVPAPVTFDLAAWPGEVRSADVLVQRRTVEVRVPVRQAGSGAAHAEAALVLARDTDADGTWSDGDVALGAEQVVGDDGVVSWPGLPWGPGRHYVARDSRVPAGFAGLADVAVDLTAFPTDGVLQVAAVDAERLPEPEAPAGNGADDGAASGPGEVAADRPVLGSRGGPARQVLGALARTGAELGPVAGLGLLLVVLGAAGVTATRGLRLPGSGRRPT